MNLGMSTNFGPVDLEHLPFPVTLKVDWVRVYQDPDNINYGCDPDDFPTQSYITQYVLSQNLFASILICGTLQVPRGVYQPELDNVGGRFRADIPQEQFPRPMLILHTPGLCA